MQTEEKTGALKEKKACKGIWQWLLVLGFVQDAKRAKMMWN